jgi:hypothetical protein
MILLDEQTESKSTTTFYGVVILQVFHMNSVSGGHPNPPPPLMDGHDVQDGPIYHGQFF